MGYRLEIIHLLLCVAFEVFTYFVLCFNFIRTYLLQYDVEQQIHRQQQEQ